MSSIVKTAPNPVVLLVDDEEDSLMLGCAALDRSDLNAIGVQTFGDALRALRNTPEIDLVMTDICLAPPREDKSGLELARYVSEHHRGTPVVGYSALFAERDLAGEEKYFDTFWEKSSGDYRAFAMFIDQCRQLALQRRRSTTPPDETELSTTMAALKSDVGALDRSVQKFEDRLQGLEGRAVDQDRLTWTVIGVIGAVVGLLGGIVALAWGVAQLFGG